MEYDKQKRKQAPKPPLTFTDVMTAIFRWLVIAPITGLFRAGRWIVKQAWRGTKWTAGLAWQGAKLPFRFVSWLFGYGSLPTFENVYQREAWLRIKRHYRRHFWRNLHTLGFIGINGILGLQLFFQWLQVGRAIGYTFFNNTLFGTGTFVVLWTLILLAHFALVRSKDKEEEALNASLEQYRGYNPPEKRKQKEYEEADEYVYNQVYYNEQNTSRLEEQTTYEEQALQEGTIPQRRTKSRR